MLLFFSLLSCHQKDSNPIPTTPETKIAVNPEPVTEPPPPPKPTTAILVADPWEIHPSLRSMESFLYEQQNTKIIENIDRVAQEEYRTVLLAIAYKKNKQYEEALPLLPQLEQSNVIPQDYRDLLCAEIYMALEQPEKAETLLNTIQKPSLYYTTAQTLLIKLLPKEKRFSLLLAQLDGAAVKDLSLILSSMLEIAPTQNQKFFVLKKIFTLLPKSALAIQSNPALKNMLKKKGFQISMRDRAERAESLMRDGRYSALISEYKKHISYGSANDSMCRLWYAYGRSLFKKNKVSDSQKPLLKLAKDCKGIRDDLGPKGYYIAGKGLERRGKFQAAAGAYVAIPENYPEHSMADDGYLLSGIAWLIQSELDVALSMWQKQIENFPDGDMIFEGYWRLAWGNYLKGNTEEAIVWADRSYSVPLYGDINHAMALRYWGARWKIYPNFSSPNTLGTDQVSKNKGITELIQICETEPTQFYALQAAQLLQKVAPEKFAEIKRPTWLKKTEKKWIVPIEWKEQEAFQRTQQFAALGLLSEAWAEAKRIQKDTATAHTIISILEDKINPIVAHDRLHKILNKYAPGQFTANHRHILEVGYPRTYWAEVKTASKDYAFDPQIFHALVREESSFNPNIVSWAGAKGLSQLMPRTAKQVAGWLDISLKSGDTFDPEINLAIGSRFFSHLHDYYKGNSFMAVGAYNAGAGNMNKWYKKFCPCPTDHLVEQVHIRETRGYIKRVLGTYQLYSTLYNETQYFPDWTRYQTEAKPK